MGGLPSLMKDMDINGQPHELSYITPDEASILKQLGGLGKPVEGTGGVPAYIGVGDAAGLGEDYGIGGSMGGGIDMGPMGKDPSYTDPNIDPTGPESAWGRNTKGWTSKQFLKDAPPLSFKDRFRVTPIGWPEVLKGMLHGPVGVLSLALQTLAGRGKDATTNTETVDEALSQGWKGSVGRSGPSTSPHSEESFDADTMSEEDFKIIEEKDKEEEKKKLIMKKYFDNLKEEEEEDEVDLSFLEGLPEDLQNILKISYGEDSLKTGLPNILKQTGYS
jgi:hypothetical protein